MTTQNFKINNIPVVLYGEAANKVCIFIHGKCGSKEEAERLAEVICMHGFQVIGIDLPEHGERKNEAAKLVPWVAVPELQSILSYTKDRWRSVSLHANSIGGYFSLLAFEDEIFEKALFVSPIADMVTLIQNMMHMAGVSEERLKEEKEIATDFGETLSWDYYVYAKSHMITKWRSKTAVLYAGHDNMTDRKIIKSFSDRFNCALKIYEDGEHWFHTEEQLAVWREFVREELL